MKIPFSVQEVKSNDSFQENNVFVHDFQTKLQKMNLVISLGFNESVRFNTHKQHNKQKGKNTHRPKAKEIKSFKQAHHTSDIYRMIP